MLRPRAVTLQTVDTDTNIKATATRRPVEVGVTAACPYGISACWGGAYQALSGMEDVDVVRPIPNADDSTAYVYLKHDGLPPINRWPAQFARTANGTHLLRGVEVTLDGVARLQGSNLTLTAGDTGRPLRLAPIQAENKIQWDHQTGALKPLQPEEQTAFADLVAQVQHAGGTLKATVTGPLSTTGDTVEVRRFVFH
jgi:galactose oxidase